MEPLWLIVLVAVVLFVSTLVRSIFGLGDALIAVPVLAFAMPVEQVAPIAVLSSITIAVIIMSQDWRRAHLRSAGWLVASTFLGIPLGLFLLKNLPRSVGEGILGVLIIALSLYFLLARNRWHLKNDRLAPAFGFAAGVLGGAYGMNGPPLAIYGSLRRWPPEYFRATLQAYFLPASLAGMASYWLGGLWTPSVTRLFIASLPGILLATFLGGAINRRMKTGNFIVYVHLGLIAIGIASLWRALS